MIRLTDQIRALFYSSPIPNGGDRSRSGNFAILSALSALPLILFIGAGIDLAAIQSQTTHLQAAADAGALAAVRLPRTASGAEKRAEAEAIFDANFGDARDGLTLTPSETPTSFALEVQQSYKTSFMQLAGFKSFTIRVTSEAEAAPADLDVVLVLDNSLSMAGGNRIVELRKAANSFLQALMAIEKSHIQVAVVPFDDLVAVSAGTLSPETSISASVTVKTPPNGAAGPVLDAPISATEKASVANGSWSGCVTDRPIPFDADGTAPTIWNAATLYPRTACEAGRKLKPVQGFTTNLTTVQTFVKSLEPNYLTNIPIGLQWGLEAFSPTAPLTGANAEALKIMILMTDGQNTDNRWPGTRTSQIDARMRAACTSVKSEKIELFTINMREGNKELLRLCATDPSHFYQVNEASQMTPVFETIAARILPVRLAQ